ncbi:hypothetical protein OCU04_002838 [Sclerotinia nivalis]|uniref:Uncharacterized protein n=1 Tax=Sclerotinia nivalis TaxID=352851 RepID=A0A9X0DML5_9HELO|nr:hypothetical protein OCU04_002838 [Sclerotinia nivalis]
MQVFLDSRHSEVQNFGFTMMKLFTPRDLPISYKLLHRLSANGPPELIIPWVRKFDYQVSRHLVSVSVLAQDRPQLPDAAAQCCYPVLSSLSKIRWNSKLTVPFSIRCIGTNCCDAGSVDVVVVLTQSLLFMLANVNQVPPS